MQAWTIKTFQNVTTPEWTREYYSNLLPYVTKFLTSQHPYRKGVMCPFMPKAIKEDLVYFTYLDSEEFSECNAIINSSIDFFRNQIGENNGSIIIILKETMPIERILNAHIKNKKKCIKNSIMLGVLYENNSATSLHSDKYFPLRTPSPTLVLRNLTSSDLMFLDPTHYSRLERIYFLSAFIKRFSSASSKGTQREVEHAKTLRMKHTARLIQFALTPFAFLILCILAYILSV